MKREKFQLGYIVIFLISGLGFEANMELNVSSPEFHLAILII